MPAKKKTAKTTKPAKAAKASKPAKTGPKGSKYLVIVESPAKSKTINKILGNDYKVLASMGHIVDLPEDKMGVDFYKDFKPEYTIMKGRKKYLSSLKKEAKDVEAIYLAADPDRERLTPGQPGRLVQSHARERPEGVRQGERLCRRRTREAYLGYRVEANGSPVAFGYQHRPFAADGP